MLAPWCAAEKWTFGVDAQTGKHYAIVSGRQRTPTKYLADPVWLVRNDYEQQLSDATWFQSNLPQSVRQVLWALRNPLQNANLFLFGCADRNYRVDVLEGYDDPMVVQTDDVHDPATGKPMQGVRRVQLTMSDDGCKRTWFSFCKGHVRYSSGVQPSGISELKINL